MQSSLKKSLYLGLAALSFASVASVTANSSNANAAKKHAAAKKVTYKTTDSKLDQSVVFKSTGKNAVYNKPVGKRSVKASLTDMKSKANSNSTKDLFMAYQEGVTSKGVHYYKVVSFDKKVRGFVYNKGVAKTNTTVAADKPANATGYLTTTSRFFNKPYGSQFKTSLKNDYKGMNIAADQFTVSDSVKVNNDQTYYYVTDKNNQLVNGWVNSAYFSNNMTDAAKNAVNSQNSLHVTYVSQNNLGSVLFTKDVNPSNLNTTTGKYASSDVKAAVKNSLDGTGVDYSRTYQNGAELNLDDNSVNVDKGSNLTVVVTPSQTASLTNYSFNAITNKGTVNQTNGDTNATAALNTAVGKGFNLTPDQYKNAFTGVQNGSFNYTNFKNTLLANGAPLNKFVDDKGNTYTFDAAYTESNAANPTLFNTDGSLKSNVSFNDVNTSKGGFKLYYDMTTPSGSTTKPSDNNVNLNGLTKSQIDNVTNAYNDANGMVSLSSVTGNGTDAQVNAVKNGLIKENVSLADAQKVVNNANINDNFKTVVNGLKNLDTPKLTQSNFDTIMGDASVVTSGGSYSDGSNGVFQDSSNAAKTINKDALANKIKSLGLTNSQFKADYKSMEANSTAQSNVFQSNTKHSTDALDAIVSQLS